MTLRRVAATVPVLALSAYVLVLPPAPSQGAEEAQRFHRTATYPVYKNLPADVSSSSATVAEISDVSPDGKTLVYTDAVGKRIGFLDISDPANPQGDGSLSLTQLGDATDEPTSVAVAGKYVLVVVNTSKSFTEPSGRLDVVRLSDAKRVRSIDLLGQPDSIDLDAAGTRGIVAIENERDEDFKPAGLSKGDLPQLPAGFVQVLDLDGAVSDWTATKVPFTNPDGTALESFASAGFVEPTDPEPEYVSINGDDEAIVSLQENNGLAVVDLRSRTIKRAFSAGTATVSGIDTAKDGTIDQSGSITDVAREPDAVQWVDDTHVATANEGDWKGGTRGWTVFDAQTGAVAWDAGNELERLAVRTGVHNEDRAAKKGIEVEGLSVATIDGTRYAFVGSERSNFVAVYDVDDPAKPVYRQVLPATNGPEGILPIPSRNLLAVSSETDDAAKGVRASVSLYQLGGEGYDFPTIESDDVDGKPIGWSALGALTADPTDPDTLYTASDTVLTNGRIFTVDVSQAPARITKETVVKDGSGAAVPLDVEGLFARPGGGFWLASEGSTGAGNKLVRTDAAGVVQQTVSLPSDVAAHVGKWGFEGVTATTDAQGDEHVWTVVQRPLWKVPTASPLDDHEGDDVARIGRYDVADGTWHWFGYRLSSPLRGTSDWMGLSEITAIDDDTFAVVERDKLNGPAARVKRVYTVDVPTGQDGLGGLDGTLPVLDKKLAIDVLPALRATKGWTQEKLEGFTVAADGELYGVTDNDGLADATGETVFLRLGQATDAFADELATTTTLGVTPSSWAFGKAPSAVVKVSGEHADGKVSVLDGSRVVATRPLVSGRASVPLSSLRPGKHRLTARFSGGPLAAASTSAVRTVSVSKARTRTTFAADDRSVRQGQRIGFSVKVAAEGTTPIGRVQVLRGRTVVKTLLLRQGKAAYRVLQKKAGSFTYTVRYLGSTTASPSTSKGQKVVVR
ncbi:esterase-like activity of phytase family protein [Aeromicrobium sp. Root495]|uniref:esterase-like activity of phytase family protein n=1 Tax=Aeromicrobium sp. Root495 TaxID=1736550 RepID=UPI0009EA312F|nr:esterase-like activity of phytase family protein [Aeromicrobium sp. Root495]